MTRVVFMGSDPFSLPTLRALLESGYEVVAAYTQPSKPAGRGRRSLPTPVQAEAELQGLPVRTPVTLRDGAEVAALRALAPDLIVVAAYGQILRPAVLHLPRHGCINVHASLLPRWRGAAPVAAAIAAGDEETGVSIMLMDPGLDTGPVLAQRSERILPDDTTASVSERLARLGGALLMEVLPGWLKGELAPRPQDDARATHAPRLSRGDGELDLARPAAELERAVRALHPWPGAWLRYDGIGLRVLRALAIDGSADPGAVVTPAPAGGRLAAFAVGTGSGLLVPLQVQREGRRPATAAEWARGERAFSSLRFQPGPGKDA